MAKKTKKTYVHVYDAALLITQNTSFWTSRQRDLLHIISIIQYFLVMIGWTPQIKIATSSNCYSSKKKIHKFCFSEVFTDTLRDGNGSWTNKKWYVHMLCFVQSGNHFSLLNGKWMLTVLLFFFATMRWSKHVILTAKVTPTQFFDSVNQCYLYHLAEWCIICYYNITILWRQFCLSCF